MRTFYFRQGISGLLMATMVAFISILCVGFLTSCGGDDDDELKVETQLLIAVKSGSSDIDGMVYIFPDGDYDPTTFSMSTLGSIETKGGQKVTGIGSGAYYKGVGTVSMTANQVKPSAYTMSILMRMSKEYSITRYK